ncbi:MAG: CapA family protein, partial [Ginsengibacter sp.]
MNKENSVLFLGDVVPYKPFRFKNNYKTVFNLECPVTKEGKPAADKIILSVKENYLKNTFKDNTLCVCLGNNHILDFGKEGLESTLKELEKLKLKWFGINIEHNDDCIPLITELNKITIAFFSV